MASKLAGSWKISKKEIKKLFKELSEGWNRKSI